HGLRDGHHAGGWHHRYGECWLRQDLDADLWPGPERESECWSGVGVGRRPRRWRLAYDSRQRRGQRPWLRREASRQLRQHQALLVALRVPLAWWHGGPSRQRRNQWILVVLL